MQIKEDQMLAKLIILFSIRLESLIFYIFHYCYHLLKSDLVIFAAVAIESRA